MKATPSSRTTTGDRTQSHTTATSATPIDLQLGEDTKARLPVAVVFWTSGDYYVEYADGSTDTIPVVGPYELVVAPRYVHQDSGETAAGLKLTAVYN